jgi:hypothetical protein
VLRIFGFRREEVGEKCIMRSLMLRMKLYSTHGDEDACKPET